MWLQIQLQLRDNDQGERLLTSAHCISPPPPFARGIFIGQLIKGVPKQLVSLPTPFSAFSPPSLSPQILSLGLSAATEVDTCFTQSLPSKTQGT